MERNHDSPRGAAPPLTLTLTECGLLPQQQHHCEKGRERVGRENNGEAYGVYSVLEIHFISFLS